LGENPSPNWVVPRYNAVPLWDGFFVACPDYLDYIFILPILRRF
jgi:hypothetical protein